MDFDRKSSNSDDKAQTGRDPLMELARLFGSKPEDAASDNYTGAGYDEAAGFPSLDASEPVQEEETGFSGNMSGLEEELQAAGYYGLNYAGEDAPSQGRQAPGRYSPVSPDIFNIGDNGAANQENNKGEESYPAENNWYGAAYPYEGAENGFSDDVAYPGLGGHQEEETQYPEWQDPRYKTLRGHEDNIAEWPRAEPAWDKKDQVFTDMFDDHGALQETSDEYLVNEAFVSDEDTLSHYGEDEATYAYESEQAPDEYAVYVENPARSSRQPGQTRPAVPTLQAHVQNPANTMFDDAFFTNAMPEEPSFEASDYEATHTGTGSHTIQEPFVEEEAVSYSDEEAVHNLDAWLDEKETSLREETGQPLEYSPYVGFQLGHNYSYIAWPEMQKPVKPAYNSYEEELGAPAGQDIDGYDTYPVGEENVYPDDREAEVSGPEMPYPRVAEAFPRFDSDNTYQHGQVSGLGTVDLDETRVEETEAFDLPSVHYEEKVAGLGINHSLDQEFADIFAIDGQSTDTAVCDEALRNAEEDFFFVPGSAEQETQGFSPHRLPGNEQQENINAVYDWAPSSPLTDIAESDAEKDFRRSGRKWLYSGLIVTALAALGTGAYIFFFPKDAENVMPAIIHAEQGEIKVKSQNTDQGTASGQEQAVYNRVEGNIPSGAEQKSLIDKTETPLDINRIDEQLPLATEGSLDQSSVEKLVNTAAAQSMPIHIVPTVAVSPERKIVIVSKPDQEAMVIRPGRLLSDEESSNVRLADNTGHAGVKDVTASQVAVSVEQNMASGKIDDMQENSLSITENGQAEPSRIADSVKKIVPPAVIPDKPAAPVQVAGNMTEQASMLQIQSAEADNAVMAPNDFYMQISSQPSKEAAQQSAYEAKQRFGGVIGDHDVVIVAAAIPGRGTYYRVRVPVGEREAALNMCERYKQAGGSCFIGR